MPHQTIDPALFSPDTRELIVLLSKHHIRYLIVGGEAVIYYGHIRTTGDVVFFYDRADDNAQRLYAALDEFWSGHIPNLARWQELTQEGMIFQFGVVPNRIDFINQIDGVDFTEAWSHRLDLSMQAQGGPVDVHLIGLKDLIKNKAATGRNRDAEDLKFLLHVQLPQSPD